MATRPAKDSADEKRQGVEPPIGSDVGHVNSSPNISNIPASVVVDTEPIYMPSYGLMPAWPVRWIGIDEIESDEWSEEAKDRLLRDVYAQRSPRGEE